MEMKERHIVSSQKCRNIMADFFFRSSSQVSNDANDSHDEILADLGGEDNLNDKKDDDDDNDSIKSPEFMSLDESSEE